MFRLLISKIFLIMMTCAVIAVSISACSAHKAVDFFHDIFSSINETDIVEGAKDFWSELVESLGNYSITDDDKLIGTRTVDADGYFSGEYYAQCYRQTTKESVFGGTSVHSRDVTVKADIKTVSGDVTVRVRKTTIYSSLKPTQTASLLNRLTLRAAEITLCLFTMISAEQLT